MRSREVGGKDGGSGARQRTGRANSHQNVGW
jgi:hypothetical protein